MTNHVEQLRQASPYINAHRNKTFVIMLPGEAVAHSNFNNIIYDLVLLHSLGARLILVHGARAQLDTKLSERHLTSAYHKNLRVTDAGIMDLVVESINLLRCQIEAKLSMNLANSPMQRARLRVVSGNFITAKPIGIIDGIDYGHTGEMRRIDRKGITRQLDEKNIVLLSPLGYSPTGETFYLASERLAREVAIALQADKLIFYGEKQGILDDQQQLVAELHPQQTIPYIQKLAGDYQGRLLTAAADACRQGVSRSQIITYVENGALLTELFTRKGSGTLVAQEQFEITRRATIDDIGGLMALIGPLEEKGILVHRSREVLEREINCFTIIEREGMVIGCAALYLIPDSNAGELACLAVSEEYNHTGKGDELLANIEQRARDHQLTTLFVLTTRTSHWFQERNFITSSKERLPEARASLYNLKRNSQVLEKIL